MTFVENWFDVDAQATLADLARSVATVGGLVVEVGAWEGRSTVALANAVAPRIVHTVDTWLGSPSDKSGKLAAKRDVYGVWRTNIATLTAGNVVAHRCDWREYVAKLDQPVAFCFIDAEHTYTEVVDNIRAIVPLMPSGGVLCGDDINCADVALACADALGGVEIHGPMWSWRKP